MYCYSVSNLVPAGTPAKLELDVGDLCMWSGRQSEHTTYRNRVIYRCVEKRLQDHGDGTTYFSHRFVVAFDLENPMGQPMDTIGFGSAREMKRLSLLDICTLRLHLDNFVREWAKSQGMGNPDDVR